MTDEELRAMVRDAIARVQSGAAASTHPSHPLHLSHPSHHPSHLAFMVPSGADAEGPCIIEPAVMCNHCGYCKCLGH
jgi:hypothetical protein